MEVHVCGESQSLSPRQSTSQGNDFFLTDLRKYLHKISLWIMFTDTHDQQQPSPSISVKCSPAITAPSSSSAGTHAIIRVFGLPASLATLGEWNNSTHDITYLQLPPELQTLLPLPRTKAAHPILGRRRCELDGLIFGHSQHIRYAPGNVALADALLVEGCAEKEDVERILGISCFPLVLQVFERSLPVDGNVVDLLGRPTSCTALGFGIGIGRFGRWRRSYRAHHCLWR
mmetsp:Transcript_18941/g.54578  ORF Transcript_18941/g.54578 Transcript_18941/m.54578 type:complete len:230 (-) Transcript_18941:161-850(-)